MEPKPDDINKKEEKKKELEEAKKKLEDVRQKKEQVLKQTQALQWTLKEPYTPQITKENYDAIVSNWIDEETQERKEGQRATEHSPESEQAEMPEAETVNPEEEKIEIEPKSRVEQIADKLASYDTKNMSDEDVVFYKENTKEIEKLLTGEKMREGDAIRKERERLEREATKKKILDTLQKGKELGKNAFNAVKNLPKDSKEYLKENQNIFSQYGSAVPGEHLMDRSAPTAVANPDTTPKTPEETETEFELNRRLYFEYTTGSAKFKKESEMFKQHAEEKGKAYQEAKKAIYQQLVDEGKIAEANEFIATEVELKRAHEIKHGPLWTKLKGGASQKIEAWEKWGVDKEGATWDEKLSNWNKRVIKRAVNIAFIGLTSSALVAGLAEKGIGSATALAGGTFSRLGAKLGWGVTLGTVMEYAMTKIPEGVNAEKSRKVLKLVLVGGGAVLGTAFFLSGGGLGMAAATGASAAAGYGLSKYIEKKGWTEKGLQEKKEDVKKKFEVKNLDTLESFEQEYMKILKQTENSRIYRKVANNLVAIGGSGLSMEMIGMTQDNGVPGKEVVGDKLEAAKRGLKKLGSMISAWWNKDDSEGVMVEERPVHETPKGSGSQDGEQKLKITPKKPELTTETEPKQDPTPTEEKEEEKTEKTERREKDDNDSKKKDYSKVRKSYLGSTGGDKEKFDAWGGGGKKVGYTEVNAVRDIPDKNENGQYLGYKDHTPPSNMQNDYEDREERGDRNYDRGPARISTEEMADKVYSNNLSKILNTEESQRMWQTLHSERLGTNAIPFLEMERNDLSIEMKNLQDYVEKVIDETKLKPKDGESIENFLSRAFDKASTRPKMLEDLIIK